MKKRIKSITAITITLVTFAILLWGLCMFCITNAVAHNYYDLMWNDCNKFADTNSMSTHLYYFYEDQELFKNPSYRDYSILDGIRYANNTWLSSWGHDSFNVMRNEIIPLQTAVILLDGDDNVVLDSGDYIYFHYVTPDIWEAENEERENSGNGFIHLDRESNESDSENDKDPYILFRTMYNGVHSLYDIRTMRITGYWEGSEIKPVAIDYVTATLVYQALEKKESDEYEDNQDSSTTTSYSYTLSSLDHDGLLEWQKVFDNRDKYNESHTELVTIYAFYPQMTVYDKGNPLTFEGTRYQNLMELLKSKNSDYINSFECSLDQTTVLAGRYFYDKESLDTDNPKPELIMLTAISGRPLLAAVSALRNVYILTFLIAILGVLIIRRIITIYLIKPLKDINEGMENDFTHIQHLIYTPPSWRDPFELFNHYQKTKDRLHINKLELARLTTALDYAKTAEQNRRQMVSNIAHELKTPLAVIHSYAEGLNEDIAVNKREKYLGVILSETERMDAMVLEMLDLSRLEAGKVKLSRDDFSLSTLVQEVFEKLEMVAQAKEITISFDLAKDCVVTADESRITQVITNFVTNALHYTSIGGKVWVKTFSERGKTVFTIENTSPPITFEEMSKVWDTFYRADKSRNGKGTGLGLAIVKSIIDLHGGTCHVRNTKNGVEFSFTL